MKGPGWSAVALALLALLDTACATTGRRAAWSAAGDASITLAPRERVTFEGQRLEVRFDRVESDSRCPVDVACIQAGEARVGITVVADDGGSSSYGLDTQRVTSVVHGGVTIALEELSPRPESSRPIRPEDYRLTLRVRR